MMGQLNLTLWAWIESVRGLRQRAVWTPFLVMALAQGAVLLLLTQFYRPWISWFLAPLVRRLGGEATLHYPQIYVALPALFSETNLVTDWVLGSFLFGVAYLLIWRFASGIPGRGSWNAAGSAFWKLFLMRLPAVLMVLVIYDFVPRWVGAATGELHGSALRMIRLADFLAAVIVEGLLLYAPLYLLVGRRSVGRSLRESLVLAGRTPLATALVVMTPNLVQIPLSAVLRRSGDVVNNLVPEAVGWSVAGAIVIYVAVNYLAIAAAVRVFGSRAAGLEGGRA